jgi:hypothetical protein
VKESRGLQIRMPVCHLGSQIITLAFHAVSLGKPDNIRDHILTCELGHDNSQIKM